MREVSPTASEQPIAEEVPQVTYASYVARGGAVRGATAPGVPVFVLKTGMVLAVGNYTYQDGRISYELASGGNGVISTDEVDWSTTTRVNSQRCVRVTLPERRSNGILEPVSNQHSAVSASWRLLLCVPVQGRTHSSVQAERSSAPFQPSEFSCDAQARCAIH